MVRTFFLVFSIMFCCLLNTNAYSQQLTGNELLSDCSKAETYYRVKCLSYVDGVINGTTGILNYFYDNSAETDTTVRNLIRKSPGFFCFPENVTKGQIVDIVKQLLERHPEIRHQDASDLILLAIKSAWPCKKAE